MNLLKKYKHWEREVYRRKAWNIGFLDYAGEKTLREPFKIAWLDWRGYDKGWFADPFILSADGNRVEVLVEEMMLDKPPEKIFQIGRRREVVRRRGRISRLEIERENGKYVLRRVVPVIEDKYHYSFPAIYRVDGKIFIHPENGESGVSPLFEYDAATGTAVRAGTLCDAPIVDGVIFEGFGGEPLLFATRVDKPEKNECENVLDVYRSKTGAFLGPYEPEPFAEIAFPDFSARGGGYFLRLDGGRVIRVAQDCNRKYGAGIVFYEMKRENGKFSFKEIARHFADLSSIWHVGLHTFNTFGNLAVVDGYGYLHPLKRALYRVKERVGRLLHPERRGA